MDQNQTYLTLFKERKALLEGHFMLSSGLHSNQYFQSALLLQDPKLAEQLGQAIGALFPDSVEKVISPAVGGIVIGQEVARAKNVFALFTEKDSTRHPILRRGFSIESGEKILVVEDVITTGLSTGEVIRVIESMKGRVIGVGSIVNRKGPKDAFITEWQSSADHPVRSLLTLDVKTWPKENCPLCAQNIPAVKPGSRKQ